MYLREVNKRLSQKKKSILFDILVEYQQLSFSCHISIKDSCSGLHIGNMMY